MRAAHLAPCIEIVNWGKKWLQLALNGIINQLSLWGSYNILSIAIKCSQSI
jgi:hypothetical protein